MQEQPRTHDALLGGLWHWEDMRAHPRRDLSRADIAALIERLCREMAR